MLLLSSLTPSGHEQEIWSAGRVLISGTSLPVICSGPSRPHQPALALSEHVHPYLARSCPDTSSARCRSGEARASLSGCLHPGPLFVEVMPQPSLPSRRSKAKLAIVEQPPYQKAMERYDVAVVGLGALGSAALYHAALKGAKVIGFEQFELGHVHGASHDTSRIVRTSYDKPEYVNLAKAAYKDWADLEKAAGFKLLHTTGGLTFLEKNGPTLADRYTSSLDANNIPYELLDAKQLRERWPQFQIRDDVDVVYTADSGIVHAAKSVSTMQFLARSHGAVLKEHTRVDSVTPSNPGGPVTIETSSGLFQASKVILTTDAWTNKLLAPLNSQIPLTVSQEQVTYYKPTQPASFTSPAFPLFIYEGEQTFYGFPCFGEPTIKVGRDCAQNFMTPETRTYVHSQKLLKELTSFVDGFIPDPSRETLRTITCLYTVTPERQIILSPLRNHQDIILGLGAAHGFKFAPALGRILAELAIDGTSRDDISKFGLPGATAREAKL
jgi:monomeric sarcosine oxidase